MKLVRFALAGVLALTALPALAADYLTIQLKDGPVVVELNPQAPKHAERLKELASEGKYDNVAFHRVIDGFMAQTGDVEFGNMEKSFDPRRDGMGGSGFCWLSASLVLSLLIMPSIVLVMDSAVGSIEKETSLTSASLGLTPSQNLVYVILPASKQWLWSSAALGFGRAAGDTLIPTMLAGNAVHYAMSPLDAMRTLTAHIGLVLSSDVGGTAYRSLFVAGGILLAVSIAANVLFYIMRTDLR